MTVEQAIYDLLVANSALTAVVPSTSIYGGNASQNKANPCIIYSRSSTFPDTTKELEYQQEIDFEIDIFSTGFNQAHEIADLVKNALNRQSGVYDDFRIDIIRFDGQDYRDFDPDNNSHQVAQGYNITVYNT